MRNPCIVFAVTASAFASVGWSETIDFTTPLAFTGGTEYVESSDVAWESNPDDPIVLSVSGEGNSITRTHSKYGRELLRATAITGFDPALATTTLCADPKKYRFTVVSNSDGTQSLRYVTNIGFVVILR